MCMACQSQALCIKVVMHEAEGSRWKEIRGGVYKAGVFSAEGERCVCESVGGNMWDRGGEDGGFSRAERTWWRQVVIGMVQAEKRLYNGLRKRLKPGEDAFGCHCGVVGVDLEMKIRRCVAKTRLTRLTKKL